MGLWPQPCPYGAIKLWSTQDGLTAHSLLIPRLPVARSAHGATVYSDKLWIFAGYDGNAR